MALQAEQLLHPHGEHRPLGLVADRQPRAGGGVEMRRRELVEPPREFGRHERPQRLEQDVAGKFGEAGGIRCEGQ